MNDGSDLGVYSIVLSISYFFSLFPMTMSIFREVGVNLSVIKHGHKLHINSYGHYY